MAYTTPVQEKLDLITKCYQGATKRLNELLTNLQPHKGKNDEVTEQIHQLNQDLVALRNAGHVAAIHATDQFTPEQIIDMWAKAKKWDKLKQIASKHFIDEFDETKVTDDIVKSIKTLYDNTELHAFL